MNGELVGRLALPAASLTVDMNWQRTRSGRILNKTYNKFILWSIERGRGRAQLVVVVVCCSCTTGTNPMTGDAAKRIDLH